MRYTDYIWDFDGMLFDTYPRMCAAFREALRQLGLVRPCDEVMGEIKRSIRGAAESYSARFGVDSQAITALYHTLEHEAPPDTMIPYADADRFLSKVVRHGRRNFLYTHRDFTALDALSRFHMDGYFSGAVTSDQAFPGKPAPDALLYLIDRYAIAPEGAVMLGDRDIDVDAAKNAGIAGCLVDPDHYYDAYDAPLRCECIADLFNLMQIE